ncbi:MAG: dihydroorotate dehydrogenase [Rubripirellula sp.]|jgi:dihydroorotate dehydrogenase (NAD+) catalytic subunit|nr:dihydroorotate dehydrogenase [Planctomycetaceae bacterium]MDF1844351.1 dihydroorotate dehydrogenase [Rubripirellula sp.]
MSVNCGSNQLETEQSVDLSVSLGRLELSNPIMVASGTFGYAREMEKIVDVSRLGGVLPKTITAEPRIGNAPWRTVETSAGLLNAIGLDNDGVDTFLEHHLPYLSQLGTAVVVSVAGRSKEDFVSLAERVGSQPGVAAIELNLSCPNVSGGIDFGTNAESCRQVVAESRERANCPIVAKLTPNVTRIDEIAKGAADGGADAVCLINTVLGIAVDWKRRKPMLGNGMGGLSGPAIKPIALRCVHQVARAVDIPIIGIGGIANIDDVMQFLVTGASAVQIGTANYYDPTVSTRLIDQLPAALAEIGASSVRDCVGQLSVG